MPARVLMPKLGLSMKTGTISAWRVADGGPVQAGQTLFVVETEKVNMEIEAAASGLVRHAEPEGAKVPPGHLIGYILADGEAAPEIPAAGGGKDDQGVTAAAAPVPAASGAAAGAGRRVSATPVARKIAQQLGVDLTAVTGSGPGGRIVKEDVEAAAAAAQAAPEPATPPSSRNAVAGEAAPGEAGAGGAGAGKAPAGGAGAGGAVAGEAAPERRPLSQMREAIARRMTASLRDSAQLTIGTEVDITDLLGLAGAMSGETVPTITDLLVLAVARALRRQPGINVSLDDGAIVQHAAVHLGLAVALTDGLVVPVLRSVHAMALGEIMTGRRALIEAARAGLLTLDDMTGSTFTITSLGQNGVTWFTPILNPPEAAILGVGRAAEQVAWRDGAAVPRMILPLSLTIDHRLIDGAPAAAFLDDLAASLREPLRLLM